MTRDITDGQIVNLLGDLGIPVEGVTRDRCAGTLTIRISDMSVRERAVRDVIDALSEEGAASTPQWLPVVA